MVGRGDVLMDAQPQWDGGTESGPPPILAAHSLWPWRQLA